MEGPARTSCRRCPNSQRVDPAHGDQRLENDDTFETTNCRSGEQVDQEHGARQQAGRNQTHRLVVRENVGERYPIRHASSARKHRRGARPHTRARSTETDFQTAS